MVRSAIAALFAALMLLPTICFAREIGTVGETVAASAATTVTKRVITIDSQNMHFDGQYREYVVRQLPAILRESALKSRKDIEIGIDGKQYAQAAQTNDRTHESGRYSAESRATVANGNWKAPTDSYSVTGSVSVDATERQTTIDYRGQAIQLHYTNVVVEVRFRVEPVDLYRGTVSQSWLGSGEVKKTLNFSLSAAGYGAVGDTRAQRENPLAKILNEAMEIAASDFLTRFDPLPLAPEQIAAAEKAAEKAAEEAKTGQQSEHSSESLPDGSYQVRLNTGKTFKMKLNPGTRIAEGSRIIFADENSRETTVIVVREITGNIIEGDLAKNGPIAGHFSIR